MGSVSPEQRQRLKEKLKSLPAAPGVYFHKNTEGEVIYVGKAAVLKNRVRQYFQKSQKDPKTMALVAEIADTDWEVVDSEMDALFLEAEMIKRYMPKWNILLRDDKSVSYVRVNFKDEVPYVTLTRNPVDDGAKYVGPFYAKTGIEKALRILRRTFPYYDRPYDGKRTLNTDLGLTPGIEKGRTTPAEYKKDLRKLVRYLEGGKAKLVRELEKAMKEAAAAGRFEEAAKARDQLFSLKELQKKIVFSDREFLDISADQALAALQELLGLDDPPRRIEGYDISHQSGTNAVGSMVVFINGAASRTDYRKFKLRTSSNDDLRSMTEVVTRRLRHQEWELPNLVVLDGGAGQVNAIAPLFAPYGIPVIGRDKSGNHARNAKTKLILPGGGILGIGNESHVAKLIARIDEESHRFAINYHTLLKRKNMLK